MTFLAPSAHHVVACVDRRDQPGNFLRRILQVGIEGDDNLTARLSEAREDRRVLSEIARQLHDSHAPFFSRRNFAQDTERVVARSVIDKDGLPRTVQAVKNWLEARPERYEVRRFVEHRHHY